MVCVETAVAMLHQPTHAIPTQSKTSALGQFALAQHDLRNWGAARSDSRKPKPAETYDKSDDDAMRILSAGGRKNGDGPATSNCA